MPDLITLGLSAAVAQFASDGTPDPTLPDLTRRDDLQPAFSAAAADLASLQGVFGRTEDLNLTTLAYAKLANEVEKAFTGGQFLIQETGSHLPIASAVSSLGLDGSGAFAAEFR